MQSLSATAQDSLAYVSSVEGGVFLAGKAVLILAVGMAYYAGDALRRLDKQDVPLPEQSHLADTTDGRDGITLASFRPIEQKDIFGSAADDAPTAVAPAPTPTSLKLRLVGTHLGQGAALAIVENGQKREQDVFQVNDMVFDQAKLVKINAESIELEHNGKIVTLELEAGASPGGSFATASMPTADQTEFQVDEADLENALANLPKLLSQARAVPYFRNGQSVGMRLFAIRRGSFYEKLGLKNGDILKGINGNSLTNPAQALKMFEQLRNERSINVDVERAGQEQNLKYDIN